MVVSTVFVAPLFGGDVTRRLGQGFDTLLDVSQRLEAGFDGGSRNVLQHVNRNGVAQTIKIIGQLSPICGEKQAVSPPIPGVAAALNKTVLDQPVKQTNQRDRLQLEHIGQVHLGKPLLLAQPEQDNPLRTRRATALGAVIDIVAQKARTFDELRN